MMDMPKISDGHRRMHRFAGVWEGDEKIAAGPWGPAAVTSGKWTSRVDIDGFFVVQDYRQDNAGVVTYRGHGILGWDIVRQNPIWYWVDSMGTIPTQPSRGRWEGDTLVFEGFDAEGNVHGRYTFAFEGEQSYKFKIENSQDGGKNFGVFMEGDYRRVG